jgi:hypothetical protein
LKTKVDYTGQFIVRYIPAVPTSPATVDEGTLKPGTSMNVTNYVSDPTTPIKLEVSSQATSNIELEVSLSSGKYSYIAIYPEIRIYIDDYVQMDVRDSISIVVTANARNEYIRKASVYSSLTLQQNRAYFYSFPNSEKTLQSAMSKTVSFDPEILALQELYMNESKLRFKKQ